MTPTHVAVATFLFLGAAPVPAQHIEVPRGAAPVIDGRATEAEWRGSVSRPLPGGGELLFKHDGHHLFIAMRGNVHGFPSVCVARGDTVRIVHASAALGTGIYVRSTDQWRRTADFTWGMRATDDGEQARAQRAAYLAAHGWVASTVRMGAVPEKEMQIALPVMAAEPRLALGYYVIRDSTVTGWPASLHDGCTDSRLVRGYAPEQTSFQMDQWASLRLLGLGKK